MKKIIFAVLLLFLTAGCALDDEKSEQLTVEVIKVIDGDTIKVKLDEKEETIRLLLVDTPETVHPTKPVQPFGKEASNYTKELLLGENVQLEFDVGERDKYGRLLAYVYIDDKMVNELLLEKGLARVAYVYEPNTKYVDKFNVLQRQARKQELGIWSIENYATDDGFVEETVPEDEKSNVLSEETDCTIKGNINSKGEKIYHTEDSPSYEVTKPEEMFCTVEEAVEAGFRAVKK